MNTILIHSFGLQPSKGIGVISDNSREFVLRFTRNTYNFINVGSIVEMTNGLCKQMRIDVELNVDLLSFVLELCTMGSFNQLPKDLCEAFKNNDTSFTNAICLNKSTHQGPFSTITGNIIARKLTSFPSWKALQYEEPK